VTHIGWKIIAIKKVSARIAILDFDMNFLQTWERKVKVAGRTDIHAP
jgi:hypothetical protein